MTLLFSIALGALLIGFTIWARRKHQRLLNAIQVVVLKDFSSSALGNQRDITVYLPPGYGLRDSERFNVLYLNDGQECDSLSLRETLARMIMDGCIRPIIVVCIPTNENRLHEYGTAIAMNMLGLGTLAPAYSRFVVEELIPLIDNTFATRPGAAIAGVSLGGLSAFDIAWNHQEIFTIVGVLSGSFWWRASSHEEHIDAGRRIAHSMVRKATCAPQLRLWFQAGTRDEVSDRDGDGVIDAIQDTKELIAELLAGGANPEDMKYVEIKGGRHDFETWARVMPAFLEWAFSAAAARQT